ncbi:MAG: L-aspartate oxidase [Actinobacteria bacterium]|nr:L-aspartate oxidase [Actinomycetota bacterium]MSW32474.1 L-aspartate oxidase [Actinomycetota bacterium]MSX34116.1 L-aspartate oxidase [Actinomycetota bacterium]MSX96459.1 L-aspartate oxidase [Actinomycetota bacterium]MSY24350.1 L-aspartate oxidase [Actinomycetota bacterium]
MLKNLPFDSGPNAVLRSDCTPVTAELDLLVVGSGVAGLSAAVRAAARDGVRVGVLTKGPLEQSTTRWAQGGVAAVLGGDPDSTDLHLADTLAAGAGLCDVDAVRILVEEGPVRVRDLVSLGARFDRDAEGQFELAREGGHSLPRIVHAGGVATGAEIERALVVAVRSEATEIHEHAFALDLVIENGRCVGVRAALADGTVGFVRARNVLLASGGAGQIFSVTTNPLEATGDGIAMALRAGAAVADIEFVQFHPTALHHQRMPRPLLSEALRGHGALIRDINGERFVDEMLPRDQVSRAMVRRMIELHTDHCLLDVTGLEQFDVRFPTIAAMLSGLKFDPSQDLLPIAPAAHYLCGGVLTDLNGATSIPGLWAAGEVACSGVHGANRLASNSLLEGMVFGARVVEAIELGIDTPELTGAMRALDGDGGRRIEGWQAPEPLSSVTESDTDVLATARDDMQWAMTVGAGVVRDASSLTATAAKVDYARTLAEATGVAAWELANLAAVATALLVAAEARTESRGAHTRDDWPSLDPNLALRLVIV